LGGASQGFTSSRSALGHISRRDGLAPLSGGSFNRSGGRYPAPPRHRIAFTSA